jgi:hypothetical protein
VLRRWRSTACAQQRRRQFDFHAHRNISKACPTNLKINGTDPAFLTTAHECRVVCHRFGKKDGDRQDGTLQDKTVCTRLPVEKKACRTWPASVQLMGNPGRFKSAPRLCQTPKPSFAIPVWSGGVECRSQRNQNRHISNGYMKKSLPYVASADCHFSSPPDKKW